MSSDNHLVDGSNDSKYFIKIPQIVVALCRNPYDFTLWSVIKMVAGEQGICKLSTSDLAALSMMSTGKVSDSRAYLLQVGLLEGSCYREPNYPQPVWHLRVPDIWLQNITWRQLNDSIKVRVELKAKLKALFEEADIYRRFDPDNFRQLDGLQDVNVKSLHNMKPSQYEEGIPQNDGGIPQNETKKNHIEPKEEPKRESTPDPVTPPVQEKNPEPEPTPPPQKRASSSKAPDSPAWQRFAQITSYWGVNKYWRGQMAETVGESPEALDLWEKVVIGWTGCGWFAGNIKGQLEYFKRGEIPGTTKKNGKDTKPYGHNKQAKPKEQGPRLDPTDPEQWKQMLKST